MLARSARDAGPPRTGSLSGGCSGIGCVPSSSELGYFPEQPEGEAVRWWSPKLQRRSRGACAEGSTIVTERLPAGLRTRQRALGSRTDPAWLEVQRRGTGDSATLIVEAKRIVEGRDVPSVRAQLEAYAEDDPRSAGSRSRYDTCHPPVRKKLTEAGLSYIDATGNMRWAHEARASMSQIEVLIVIRGVGLDTNVRTLKGQPAAKIVRAIADFAGKWRDP